MNNVKGMLQELCVKRGLELPVYEKLSKVGPDHAPTITVKLTANGIEVIEAASSRAQAEKLAAATLYEKMKHLEVHDERKSVSIMSILMVSFANALINKVIDLFSTCKQDIIFCSEVDEVTDDVHFDPTLSNLMSSGLTDRSAWNRLYKLLSDLALENGFNCITRKNGKGLLFRSLLNDDLVANESFKNSSLNVAFNTTEDKEVSMLCYNRCCQGSGSPPSTDLTLIGKLTADLANASGLGKHSVFTNSLKQVLNDESLNHNDKVTILLSQSSLLKNIQVEDLLTLVRSTISGADSQVRIDYD
ncbi:Vp8 [Kadipiro virus]|uniref:Vp8 n=1 Tax=Kadipiro virus TaxID=104580 RepID=Q9YWP6_9REOV|nr:Vp8 [Kadipiro virus]AAC72049.1 Vp8 [Kadipiro virus]